MNIGDFVEIAGQDVWGKIIKENSHPGNFYVKILLENGEFVKGLDLQNEIPFDELELRILSEGEIEFYRLRCL